MIGSSDKLWPAIAEVLNLPVDLVTEAHLVFKHGEEVQAYLTMYTESWRKGEAIEKIKRESTIKIEEVTDEPTT